jgi:hypothetical protein
MTIKRSLFYVAAAALAFSACQNQHADLAPAPKPVVPFNYDSVSYERAKQYVKITKNTPATSIPLTPKRVGLRLPKRNQTRAVSGSAPSVYRPCLIKLKAKAAMVSVFIWLLTIAYIIPRLLVALSLRASTGGITRW